MPSGTGSDSGSSGGSTPLMLTDRPWSELEKIPVEQRLSGSYRAQSIPLSIPQPRVRIPFNGLHQMLPAASPKLLAKRYLRPNASPTSEERQKPATDGDKLKRKVGKSAFDNDRDSYFTTTKKVVVHGKSVQLHALVLGWNHAAILKSTPDGYVVHRLYCYATEGHGHKAFGLLDASMKELPTSGDDLVDETRGTWRICKAPPLVLERLVTYGVSSCSFSVLHTLPEPEFIAISHMSGKPPIPVGLMLEDFLDEDDEVQLVVSHLPQSNELGKFDHDVIFSRPVRCHTVLMSRGKVPTRDEGDRLFPQMGHADVGVVCTPGKIPFIEGTIGVGADQDYVTLLPAPVSSRLNASATLNGYEKNLVFSVGDNHQMKLLGKKIPSKELIELCEARGHMLAPLAKVQVVKANQEWKIVSVGPNREYRVVHESKSLNFYFDQEPYVIGAEVVVPLISGDYGFRNVHREMFEALIGRLQILAGSFQPKSWFQSSTALELFMAHVILDYKESRNAQRAFARLIGGFLNFTFRDHPCREVAAAVMKKNRYEINIPLKKIGRL